MPTALIADDERLMREQIRLALQETWPELQIVAMPTRDADAAGVRLMTATLKTLLADLPLLAERADSVEITVRRP